MTRDPVQPRRLVVFGATGHLGREVVDRLAEGGWPIGELVCVASPESAGLDLEFRGEPLDVLNEWPRLQGRDLVFVCTPREVALEVVREALRAEVPCIDCTGALVERPEVPMPVRAMELEGERAELERAPLIALASPTTIAWAPLLEALTAAAGVSRVVATVLSSASAWGRQGVVALSEESIALFNQAEAPGSGPAGQSVAFDVIPGGGLDTRRVELELERLFGASLRLALSSVQVPTFVGEGAALSIELDSPLEQKALETLLERLPHVTVVMEGAGSRGLALVEEEGPEPTGPTLRDSAGSNEILVGRLRPDPSLPLGQGWLLWISFDPLGLAAEQALRVARRRLGLS